jgi:DEAD/DEAH box helicase domain-containing protein
VRLYAPAAPTDVLERLLADPQVAPAVVTHRLLPARPADYVPFPDWLDERLAGALRGRGIEQLYSHQAEALGHLRDGRDIVVVTPTASGKSLCYDLPVLQSLTEDPSARALYLFPTKALSQDQLAAFRDLAAAAQIEINAAVYDGDTPVPIRTLIRSAGQVVVTNPDMLHSAILPHHTKWFQLFEQLRYVVVDEAHTYRGIFGSHVANVLRRLLRLCAHYGSTPQFIFCSATIGNPQSLAETLLGRPVAVVDRNGAPAGEKHVVVLNPPVVDQRTGMRPGPLGLAHHTALAFLRAGRQTICFARARVQVELLLTSLREAFREGRGPLQRIRGYRGGYLPTERRAIEAGLRSGDVLGVVSTNALELGIDIGRLDAAVLAGYPGSIAATWQQMGRSGRRLEPSVAILIAGPGPVDQFVANHSDYLFDSAPEEARLDPTNLHVLLAHVRSAAFELPFDSGDALAGVPTDELLHFLAEEGHVRRADDNRWYWASENFPASEVSLRVGAPENVVIIDTTGAPRPRVIGEIDLFAAPVMVYDNAIYIHESRQYHVEHLDWEERRAYVKPVDVDYYTQALLAVTLKPLEAFASSPVVAAARTHGEVMVSTIATLYKKLRLETNENIGWGKIHLPEIEMHTTAYWVSLSSEFDSWRRDELDTALAGAGRAMQTVGSVLLMSDPHDLGMVAQVRSPHAERPVIYLYDGVPGGVGLAARLYERHDELVAGALALVDGCACERGCPACVGPRADKDIDGKRHAQRLLALLAGADAGGKVRRAA